MERATAVVARSTTHSANFYEIPSSATSQHTHGFDTEPAFASTWGPSTTTSATTFDTMRRGASTTTSSSSANSLDPMTLHRKSPLDPRTYSSNSSASRTVNADEPRFQPAFAFDVNDLVSSLRRTASTSSLHASSTSSAAAAANAQLSRSASTTSHHHLHASHTNGSRSPTTTDTRIQVVPVEPVLIARRTRRDALSGSEHARSQVLDSQNSIINYNLNRRKKKPITGMPTTSSSSTSSSNHSVGATLSPQAVSPPRPALSQTEAANARAFSSRTTTTTTTTTTASHTTSVPLAVPPTNARPPPMLQQSRAFDGRGTTTITTPNGIEYTTDVPTRVHRVTSFYEESFTF